MAILGEKDILVSGVVGLTAQTATLDPAANAIAYLSALVISMTGTGGAITVSTTGLKGDQLEFRITDGGIVVLALPEPIPASAVNTDITLTGTAGSGSTLALSLIGFQSLVPTS